MAKKLDLASLPDKTDADIALLLKEQQRIVRRHKIIRRTLAIAGLVLLAGVGITIFPWGLAAFGSAWWAVNGSLAALALMGEAAAGISILADRRNVKNLKALEAEQEIRKGVINERQREKMQGRINDKNIKGLSEEAQIAIRKPNPEKTSKTATSTIPVDEETIAPKSTTSQKRGLLGGRSRKTSASKEQEAETLEK